MRQTDTTRTGARPGRRSVRPGLRWLLIGLGCCLGSGTLRAEEINIGYQTGIEPAKRAIASGAYEKNTGVQIKWHRFDNGAELIRAMASGNIQIGNVGSSVLATAASRRLPMLAFYVAAQLGKSEALVAHAGSAVTAIKGLEGKTIAVPYVSTAHYSLLSVLKHAGVDLHHTKVVNMRISEIPAAWSRGNIDAAYVWEPALGKIKQSGTVLATSADAGEWGTPTFDLWISAAGFAASHTSFLDEFVATSLAQLEAFHANPAGFAADPANLDNIARVTGATTADIRTLLGGDRYPLAAEQSQLLTGAVAKALRDTAEFLKNEGNLDIVLPDYSDYVTARFIPKRAAAGSIAGQ